jgi:proline iminopeptidase
MGGRAIQEGFIPVTGGRVWYRMVGTGGSIPLLTLHGGPGVPHDYLEALESLADERPVVFYDQLGCGKSDRPDDPTLWQIERFVEEVGQVREALGLERIHLFGHSWGSMLAADYALTQPAGLTSVILAGPILSNTRYLAELQRLRAQLPIELQRDLDHHEQAGTYDDPAYQAALGVFYKRHLARIDPPPESSQRAGAGANGSVYQAMWGPSEFVVSGTLQGYEREDRLHELTLPVLLTCGREDLTTPEAAEVYRRLLPEAELVVFEASAHGPHDEEPELYEQTVRDFLRRAEARAQ